MVRLELELELGLARARARARVRVSQPYLPTQLACRGVTREGGPPALTRHTRYLARGRGRARVRVGVRG